MIFRFLFLCRPILVVALFMTSVPTWAATKNILITGYWHPTNQMIRRFSPDPILNPEGWIGENWEGLGYDIYAYFPTFGRRRDSIGFGDFPVDFRATYNDFIYYTDLLSPVAIVSFGQKRGAKWELEVNLEAAPDRWLTWDKTFVTQIDEPLSYSVPSDLLNLIENYTIQHTSFPVWDIIDEVNAGARDPYFASVHTDGTAGNYLCGFISYLGAWYHSLHASEEDPRYNALSGFIHTDTTTALGESATHATLRATIRSLP
jgi:hypothetical protein